MSTLTSSGRQPAYLNQQTIVLDQENGQVIYFCVAQSNQKWIFRRSLRYLKMKETHCWRATTRTMEEHGFSSKKETGSDSTCQARWGSRTADRYRKPHAGPLVYSILWIPLPNTLIQVQHTPNRRSPNKVVAGTRKNLALNLVGGNVGRNQEVTYIFNIGV